MKLTSNPFVQRQLGRARSLERDIVIAYARAASAGLQLLTGREAEAERVDHLNDALHRAEQRFAETLESLARIGVPVAAFQGLGNEARAALFEAHFEARGSGLLTDADIHDLAARIPGLP